MRSFVCLLFFVCVCVKRENVKGLGGNSNDSGLQRSGLIHDAIDLLRL